MKSTFEKFYRFKTYGPPFYKLTKIMKKLGKYPNKLNEPVPTPEKKGHGHGAKAAHWAYLKKWLNRINISIFLFDIFCYVCMFYSVIFNFIFKAIVFYSKCILVMYDY